MIIPETFSGLRSSRQWVSYGQLVAELLTYLIISLQRVFWMSHSEYRLGHISVLLLQSANAQLKRQTRDPPHRHRSLLRIDNLEPPGKRGLACSIMLRQRYRSTV